MMSFPPRYFQTCWLFPQKNMFSVNFQLYRHEIWIWTMSDLMLWIRRVETMIQCVQTLIDQWLKHFKSFWLFGEKNGPCSFCSGLRRVSTASETEPAPCRIQTPLSLLVWLRSLQEHFHNHSACWTSVKSKLRSFLCCSSRLCLLFSDCKMKLSSCVSCHDGCAVWVTQTLWWRTLAAEAFLFLLIRNRISWCESCIWRGVFRRVDTGTVQVLTEIMCDCV